MAVDDRRDRAIDDRHRGRDQRRLGTGVEGLQQSGDGPANQKPERDFERAQAEQSEQRAADDADEQRGVVDQAQQPAEQRHQQRAGEDALPDRLRLGRGVAQGREHLGRRVQHRSEHRAGKGAYAIDRLAEHGPARGAEHHAPDQRIEHPAGTAAPASVGMTHGP